MKLSGRQGIDGDRGIVMVKADDLELMSDYDQLIEFLENCKAQEITLRVHRQRVL